MKITDFKILKNEWVSPDCFELSLEPWEDLDVRPGQFLELSVPGKTLRRPVSVCGRDGRILRLCVRAAGEGTVILSGLKNGVINAIGPLGNGFSLPGKDPCCTSGAAGCGHGSGMYKEGSAAESRLLIVGGGIGCAPLLLLAEEAVKAGLEVTAVFGFRDREHALFEREMKALALRSIYCFDSEGDDAVSVVRREGLTDLPFRACGPLPMMEGLASAMSSDGEFSVETRMGCGFGACMGCSIRTVSGMKRICKDGPVFRKGEIVWQSLR